MYDNPMAVYREYIQNSIDAIAMTTPATEPRVEITVDPSKRRIRVWDNGPGLNEADALRQLLPIGRSSKQLGSDRGFRGIGRLAGLAFAETVTFSTRAHHNEPMTRVTWNASRLPRSTTEVGAIEDAVRNCIDVEVLSGLGCPDHFFEVEMRGVARHAAGSLLNRDAVRSYVSEVCPVPMSASFPYSKRVAALFGPSSSPMSLDIFLDGDPEPVKRPHGGAVRVSQTREDQLKEFEELRIPSIDLNRDAAVGWVAHSSYLGAILKDSRVRGLRARVGNIQIGDESIFDHLYAEDRFNRWCIGEIHILDDRIVPNARRDYFEPGPHLRNLENHLIPTLRSISARCRTASAQRNRERKLLDSLGRIEESYDLARSGYLAEHDATTFVQQALQRLAIVRESLLSLEIGADQLQRLEVVESKLNDFRPGNLPHRFRDTPSSHIGTYQKVFQALVWHRSASRHGPVGGLYPLLQLRFRPSVALSTKLQFLYTIVTPCRPRCFP